MEKLLGLSELSVISWVSAVECLLTRVPHCNTHTHTHTGIPGSKLDFIRFVQGVRTFREGMEAPVIVHCRYSGVLA